MYKMLILTRKINEAITINDNIKISVLDVNGQQVKLGCDAPIEVPIFREEVLEKIKAGKYVKNNK